MNREEAKIILAAYRPNGADADDPRFAGALALACTDAELRAWFEAGQSADKVIAAKLRAAPLPPDLLGQIRSGVAARQAGRPRYQPVALALAASIVLLGLIAGLLLTRPTEPAPGTFAALQTDMAAFLREMPQLDIAEDRVPEIRAWLTRQPAFASAQLPQGLEKFPGIGCRTIEWQNQKLALVCFMVEGQVMHVFVMPRSAFPELPASSTPHLAKVGGQNTASWASGDHIYLIVTLADKAVLHEIL